MVSGSITAANLAEVSQRIEYLGLVAIDEQLDVTAHALVLVDDAKADAGKLAIEVAGELVERRPFGLHGARLVRVREQRVGNQHAHGPRSVGECNVAPINPPVAGACDQL